MSTFDDAAAAVQAWMDRQRADTARLMAIVESPAEARMLVEMLAHGEPGSLTFGVAGSGAYWTITPQRCVRVSGKTYRVDFALEHENNRVALEIDGWAFHSSEEQTQQDRARDAALGRDGWRVIRIAAWRVVQSPLGSVETLLAKLTMLEQHGRAMVPVEDMTEDEFAVLVGKFETCIKEAIDSGETESVYINRTKLKKLRKLRSNALSVQARERGAE